MTASAFSPDGSVLAIATGPKVTLWDPHTCRLAAVLPLSPEHHKSITLEHQVRMDDFIYAEGGRILDT